MKWRAHEVDGRLAAINAVKIRAALRQTIDADALYQAYLDTHPMASKNRTLDRTKARSWAIMHVRFDNEALYKVLRRMWAETYLLGSDSAKHAAEKLIREKKAVTPDWANWKPGNRAAELLLRPKGALKNILDDAQVTIKGIDNTGYDRIGTALADAFALGLSPSRSAKLIYDIIADPARCLTISITEGSRAMNLGAIDTYQQIGLDQVEWSAADPCEICAENDGQIVEVGQSFNSGDTEPPAHPNCRCALLPVIPDYANNDYAFTDILTP